MRFYLLSIILISGAVIFAQQASDYFPQQLGYKWNFKVIPLDSANNEIDSLTYFRADSFAVVTNFMGRDADLVLSKSGSSGNINILPYLDSSYFSFENTDGYEYFRISNLGNLITVLDSIGADSTFLGVIESFENWYSIFRFNESVGTEYTIFTKDTSLTINGTDLPLRFQYFGKRLDDETIQTDAGTYLCKKFLLSTVVSYLIILPPPLPPIPIEIIRSETTKWISENVWLVQEITPTKTFDLSYLGYGSFTIPGTKTILIPAPTPVELMSFTAEINESNVLLHWQTATEINNRGFEIQRNQKLSENDPSDWINIGFIAGQGTTTKPCSYSFTDFNMNGINSQYRLKQFDFNGDYTYSNVIETGNNPVQKFALEQNYPNPFNPSTKINFNIPESGNVSLKVINILGKEILTLLDEQKNAGSYSVTFNPGDYKISSGVYIYILKFKGIQLSHKMIYLR